MDHILACDCGGTKCTFLLCAADGTVTASVTGGTSNANFESEQAVAEKIHLLLCRLRDEAGIDPGSVKAWGGVLMIKKELLEPAVRSLFPCCTVFLSYREYEVNLMAAARVTEGLIAHSGTGSFAAGKRDGRLYYYGGLGSYLGDEGSGYAIGLSVFNAVKRDLVGLAPATLLRPMLRKEWAVQDDPDLETALYNLSRDCIRPTAESRSRLCRLTRLAARAAALGDEVAISLLHDGARAMYDHIRVLVDTEGYPPRGLLTVSGGTWHCGTHLTDTFFRLCKERWPDLSPVLPRLEPISGVALCLLRDALKLDINGISDDALPHWTM